MLLRRLLIPFLVAVAACGPKATPNTPPGGGSQTNPLTDAGIKKFLADWGYKFSTDVRDAKTGLYVAKFDPVDPKSGVAPVVAFRGSEGGSHFMRVGHGMIMGL